MKLEDGRGRLTQWIGLHKMGNTVGQDFAQYCKAILFTPYNLYKRAFHVHNYQEDVDFEKGDADNLRRVLSGFDLVNLGIGIILGAGVFVVTGQVANELAGAATFLSFCVAGLSALLSAFCYSEYAVDYPRAGGAFTFMLMTFGEFPAWICVGNLIFEYVLANAAVARSFSPYFASLTNQDSDFYLISSGGYEVDFWAFGLILVLSALLLYGIRESKTFNNIITFVHVILVIFIIVLGFIKADKDNFTPFAPYGSRGIFNGASLVFFSYIGFDAIATTAEECKNPSRDMPIGIIGSLTIVTTLYILCALALTFMLPYYEIPTSASFSQAFELVGLDWAKYIVAAGALTGIVTGTMIGLLAVSRLVTSMGREYMVPPFFAIISRRFGTPAITTALLGIATAIIGLLTAFDQLINLVSICTIFVFWMVANGTIFRRYHVAGKTNSVVPILFLLAIDASSIVFSTMYQVSDGWSAPKSWICLVVPAAVWAAITLAMQILVKQAYVPPTFRVPLMPWLPSFSIFLNTFLLGTIEPRKDYVQFAIFIAVLCAIYLLYSLPATHIRFEERSRKGGPGAFIANNASYNSSKDVQMGYHDAGVQASAPPAVASV